MLHCLLSYRTDASGNKKLPDIGAFLKDQIAAHFKQKSMTYSLKYHDPSYMVRSVPPCASDSIYCMVLAQNAVHGAMAGYTGFTSALVNNRTVYLPFDLIAATSPTRMNRYGRTWERVVSSTHQPPFEKHAQSHYNQ
jgi:6-phosphofructokinase 1